MGVQKILKTSINGLISEINLDKILTDFKMDMDMFVDFCILAGCDYCDTISQVGPVTSYNQILKHGNIEKFIENNKSDNCEMDFISARNIFKNFLYDLPDSKIFIKKSFDKNELLTFLNKHNLKENVISKFFKILN